MKIAFISYEYPPDTAFGGIATYVKQAAEMLYERNHHVEVFVGSEHRTQTDTENGVIVHRINSARGAEFRNMVGTLFAKRNTAIKFDVLEGPDFDADAYNAIRLVPNIPLVIKLHSPSYLIGKLNSSRTSAFTDLRYPISRARVIVRALRQDVLERRNALDADEVAAASASIGQVVARTWKLNSSLVAHVPLPYEPSQQLLDIPVDTNNHTVLYFGRLETRKGVIDLAKAIGPVLKVHPNLRFRFVGRDTSSPTPGIGMKKHLSNIIGDNLRSVDFSDHVPLIEIPSILAQADLCVFPSLYESFGLVCLEAMSAARGVIVSSSGGMAEIIDHGRFGLLVPPSNYMSIAQKIIEMTTNSDTRKQLGYEARSHVLAAYNKNRVGQIQEESYGRAIARRHSLGPRPYLT